MWNTWLNYGDLNICKAQLRFLSVCVIIKKEHMWSIHRPVSWKTDSLLDWIPSIFSLWKPACGPNKEALESTTVWPHKAHMKLTPCFMFRQVIVWPRSISEMVTHRGVWCWHSPRELHSPWHCSGCGCLWSPAKNAGSSPQQLTLAEAYSCGH